MKEPEIFSTLFMDGAQENYMKKSIECILESHNKCMAHIESHCCWEEDRHKRVLLLLSSFDALVVYGYIYYVNSLRHYFRKEIAGVM